MLKFFFFFLFSDWNKIYIFILLKLVGLKIKGKIRNFIYFFAKLEAKSGFISHFYVKKMMFLILIYFIMVRRN